MRKKGYRLHRYPLRIARYTMLRHVKAFMEDGRQVPPFSGLSVDQFSIRARLEEQLQACAAWRRGFLFHFWAEKAVLAST